MGICVKLLYTAKSSVSQVIVGSLVNYYFLPSFEIQPSGVIWAGLSTGGTTWNYGVLTTKALEVNKWYYVRYRYDGTKYYIEVSTDGISYEVWSTINTSAVTYASGAYELGGIATSNNHYMQFGHIDLKGTYIKVNDEVIWGAKCCSA